MPLITSSSGYVNLSHVNYAVVCDSSIESVVCEVVSLMSDGLQPLGGIAVDRDGNFYQAVIRKTD